MFLLLITTNITVQNENNISWRIFFFSFSCLASNLVVLIKKSASRSFDGDCSVSESQCQKVTQSFNFPPIINFFYTWEMNSTSQCLAFSLDFSVSKNLRVGVCEGGREKTIFSVNQIHSTFSCEIFNINCVSTSSWDLRTLTARKLNFSRNFAIFFLRNNGN